MTFIEVASMVVSLWIMAFWRCVLCPGLIVQYLLTALPMCEGQGLLSGAPQCTA